MKNNTVNGVSNASMLSEVVFLMSLLLGFFAKFRLIPNIDTLFVYL